MVECGGLENRYVGNPGVEGSNPSLSAPRKYLPFLIFFAKNFGLRVSLVVKACYGAGVSKMAGGGSSRGDLVGFAFGGMGHNPCRVI